jgi:hypothetical protein
MCPGIKSSKTELDEWNVNPRLRHWDEYRDKKDNIPDSDPAHMRANQSVETFYGFRFIPLGASTNISNGWLPARESQT